MRTLGPKKFITCMAQGLLDTEMGQDPGWGWRAEGQPSLFSPAPLLPSHFTEHLLPLRWEQKHFTPSSDADSAAMYFISF